MCETDCTVYYVVLILNCIDFEGVSICDISPYFRGVKVE